MYNQNMNTDIVWAAGFLDGEGCFGWYDSAHPKGRFRQLLVSATQKDREPLERLQRTLNGGTILEHSKKTSYKNGGVYWRWQANGEIAAQAMRAVLPYMCSRRTQKIRESLQSYDAHREHMRQKREKPTCNKGHLWSDNIGFRKSGIGKGKRYCKACAREYARQAKHRAKT